MSLEIPPALAPGVTIPQRDNKFQNWNGTHGYYQRADVRLQPYQTDNMRSMVYKQEDLLASSGICNTMRIANKATVVGSKKGAGSAPEQPRPIDFKRSISHQSYADFVGLQTANWQKINSGDDFWPAFDSIASKNDGQGDDSYIRMHDVMDVLHLALSDAVPQFVTEKFMKLCKRAEVGGRVYWADFRRLAISALVAATADCSLKKELPPLVMLMTKPRLIDPELGPMTVVKTSYADTFGSNFSTLMSEPESAPAMSTYTKFLVKKELSTAPELRPKSMLNPAAADLAAGTPKGTHQIPGYTGHMPMNVRNPVKHGHSGGDHLHPVVNSLRMTKKGGSNVLGYAGHVPWHADSERERLSGCDPRTSTGAAFGATRLTL
jgi:hypothetical protein